MLYLKTINEYFNIANKKEVKRTNTPLKYGEIGTRRNLVASMTGKKTYKDNMFMVWLRSQYDEKEWDNITELYCSDRGLTTLEGIENLPNLKILYCKNNKIKSLDGIEYLPKLEKLNISYNVDIEIDKLKYSRNLKILIMDNLNLYDKDIDVISDLTSLEELNCSNNNLLSLPLRKLTNLKILNVSYNDLRDLNDIGYLSNLIKLNCASNKIPLLKGIENTKLEFLEAYKNNLTSLDVTNLTSLKYLGITSNHIEYLDVSKLLHLEHLFISENNLKEIDIRNLFNLKEFACKDNDNLSIIGIERTKNLKYFYK